MESFDQDGLDCLLEQSDVLECGETIFRCGVALLRVELSLIVDTSVVIVCLIGCLRMPLEVLSVSTTTVVVCVGNALASYIHTGFSRRAP